MHYITLFILMLPILGFSQQEEKCKEIYKEIIKKVSGGELDEALEQVKKTDKKSVCKDNPEYAYYRAYTYKQKFKTLTKEGKKGEAESYRKMALESATYAYQNYTEDNPNVKQLVEYLATTYYNDGVRLLDEHLADSAYSYYLYFRNSMWIVDSTNFDIDVDQRFYQNLIYQYYYLHKNTDEELQYDNILEVYEKALAIDSSDWVMCYNYRVMQINKMMRTPPYKNAVKTILNSEAYWYIQHFEHPNIPKECMKQIIEFNREFDLEEINMKADELVILDQLILLYNRAIAFWPDIDCDPKREVKP